MSKFSWYPFHFVVLNVDFTGMSLRELLFEGILYPWLVQRSEAYMKINNAIRRQDIHI